MNSARRVLDVLELVAQHPKGLSLAQVSKTLGTPRSTTHGVLHCLTERRYLTRGETGTFSLGIKVLELGGAYAAGLELTREFHAVAKRIVATCGETVQMAILDGKEVVYVAKEDGSQPVRLASFVGRRLPAHIPALGKVLLASLSDAELDSLYVDGAAFVQTTSRTIGTKQALLREMEKVRGRGLAHDNEEVYEGVQCLAAPVVDRSGRVVAAISIAFLSVRATDGTLETLSRLIVEGARDLSTRMGFVGNWSPYDVPMTTAVGTLAPP